MSNPVRTTKTRSVGLLQQACERYTTMAYETLWRELAIGFKSSCYRYEMTGKDPNAGTFIATLEHWTPPNQSDSKRRETRVYFDVYAGQEEGSWRLSRGLVADFEKGGGPIRFSDDGQHIAILMHDNDEIPQSSHDDHNQDATLPLHQEPWDSFKDFVIIQRKKGA